MPSFTPIPVTRNAVSSRAHADITVAVNKSGDLAFILSPEFFAKPGQGLSVGAKILAAYDSAEKKLLIAPAGAGQTQGIRTLRKRHGFPGAATLLLTANNLPASMPRPVKRVSLLWEPGENGAIIVSMEA